MGSFNIYCDESSHLPNDRNPFMILGATKCPTEKSKEISTRILEIKQKHGTSQSHELKWTNVSPSKLALYLDLIDYFFDDDDLSFRVLVAPKNNLDHSRYNNNHDDWYYKMLYQLFVRMIHPDDVHNVYLDKKDIYGGAKVRKLREVLSNAHYDFDKRIVRKIQITDSSEVRIMQLADVILGAVGYANKGNGRSSAKLAVVDRIRQRSGFRLTCSTLPSEPKFNIFVWEPRR